MAEKMWSGRFREPLDPQFERWQRSFPFDRRLVAEELDASRAWARALGRAGVLSTEEVKTIVGGLDQIGEAAQRDPRFLENDEAEDIHHYVEMKLVALVGEVGNKLHTGRSRNEQIATDLRLYLRWRMDEHRLALVALIEALLKQAEANSGAAMPAYTHMQRAEPVLVAHWLLAFVEMFFRDASRLADCRKRVNVLPLGSGAVAGASVAIDREALARELGFEGISANSMDATSDRDFALEYLQTLTMHALHLSRWAEELTLFATTEYGFVILPDAFSTGSSAMPQKKNPDPLELIRGKAGRIFGASAALAMMMKGLPLAYNKDLQESQESVFDAAEQIEAILEMAAKLAAALRFDTKRMQTAATTGHLNATAAAHYLVRKGVPFRRAHAAIGQAVQYCIERRCALEDLKMEELRRFSPEFSEDFYASVKLESVLAEHDVPGGTAPQRVAQALAEARTRLAALRPAADRAAR